MRFVRYTLVCLSALFIPAAVTAAGQQQTPPPPPATMPAPAGMQMPSLEPAGPVKPLSVDEAVTLALRNNLGLQIERLNPAIEDELIASARSGYVPTLSTAFRTNGSITQPRSFTEGNEAFSTDSISSSFTFTQQALPWTNTQLQASWSGSRTTTGGLAPSFNPNIGSSFNVQAAQPLLRNFLVKPIQNQIEQAVISRQIADITLRQRVVGTERSVRQAYWNLVGAIERLSVARQNLDLSQTQLKNNRVRVEVGTMAPIDIIAAEAEVAGNEEAVITAEAAIRANEDALRILVMDPNAPDFWTSRIEPTNKPEVQAMQINLETAIASALESRTDMVNARKQLQVSDLSLKLSKNQTLPDLSLNASLTGTASGGTQFSYFPGTITEDVTRRSERGFGSTLGDVFGFAYPNWSVGVNFAYPIGKAAAEANHARATLQRRQFDAQMKSLELSVVQQVRGAARNVTSNFQRVQSTRVARDLAEKRLAAQQKRFDVGLSTLFELTQAQRDVVLQRNNELNAVIAYNQAIVDFQLVQVAPLGGF
ncbi:MAG: TolC family protein [Acidobacteriota bacterium]|nr:TolC family protein [Acidobacteriota bacterium]